MRKRLEVDDQEIVRLYNEGKSTFDIEKFLSINSIKSSIYTDSSCSILNVSNFYGVYAIYSNMYKDSSYYLKRKYDKFCPLVKKFTRE